jgi:HK97 family phage major capsid protein
VPNLLDQLREQRATARTAGDEILTRAASEGREPTPDELAQYQAQVVAEREAADAMEAERDRQLAEVRAMATRGRSPTLTRQAAETARAFRSAIFAKNPQPIEVYADELADEWPDDVPEPVYGRAGRVRIHTRDTIKTTATQALSTDVYSTIVQHMVETSSLMAAGATVVTTSTGEDLIIPKSTGFVSSAIIGEGASITESDPTLATVTLKAFKYANYFEISQELANDTPTNLLSFLARQAALSLGLGTTGFGDDIINGAGTTEPRGLLLDAATGVTGPAGTGTTLGAPRAPPTGHRRPLEPGRQRRRALRLQPLGRVPAPQRLRHHRPQAQGQHRPARPGPDHPRAAAGLSVLRRPVHAGHGEHRRVDRLRRHVEVLHQDRQRGAVRAVGRVPLPE